MESKVEELQFRPGETTTWYWKGEKAHTIYTIDAEEEKHEEKYKRYVLCNDTTCNERMCILFIFHTLRVTVTSIFEKQKKLLHNLNKGIKP